MCFSVGDEPRDPVDEQLCSGGGAGLPSGDREHAGAASHGALQGQKAQGVFLLHVAEAASWSCLECTPTNEVKVDYFCFHLQGFDLVVLIQNPTPPNLPTMPQVPFFGMNLSVGLSVNVAGFGLQVAEGDNQPACSIGGLVDECGWTARQRASPLARHSHRVDGLGCRLGSALPMPWLAQMPAMLLPAWPLDATGSSVTVLLPPLQLQAFLGSCPLVPSAWLACAGECEIGWLGLARCLLGRKGPVCLACWAWHVLVQACCATCRLLRGSLVLPTTSTSAHNTVHSFTHSLTACSVGEARKARIAGADAILVKHELVRQHADSLPRLMEELRYATSLE